MIDFRSDEIDMSQREAWCLIHNSASHLAQRREFGSDYRPNEPRYWGPLGLQEYARQ